MHTSPPPPPADTDQAIFRQLASLTATERRARLRALLPLIDDLVRRGVPYDAITGSLTEAGLPIKTPSLRQALWRWRKKVFQKNGGPDPLAPATNAWSGSRDLAGALPGLRSGSSSPRLSASEPAPLPAASSRAGAPAVNGIASKADLVRLRRDADPIDLNQLADIGRQK